MDILQEQQALFTNYCQNGDLELAKALFITNPHYFATGDAMLYSMQHYQHDITRWLMQVSKERRNSEQRNSEQSKIRQGLFDTHCKNGELELAQALFKTDPQWLGIGNALDYSSKNNQPVIEHWLREVYHERFAEARERDRMQAPQEQFSNHCANGDLELAKQFLEVNLNIRVSWQGYDAFIKAIMADHTEVAIWLLTVMNQNKYYFDDIFSIACHYGHLGIAQWIFQKYPNIDIFFDDNEGFTWACVLGHKNVIKWLLTLNPNQYINMRLVNLYEINRTVNRSEFALIRASRNDDFCHALWILFFKPDIRFTAVDDQKMREKIYTFVLLYCFDHKNINMLML